MIDTKSKHDNKRNMGRLLRGIMVCVLLVNYLPVTSLSNLDKIEAVTGTAAAPVIQKDIDHTSRYIQSSVTYQRGLREYVTAASPDGGVLSYAWFINTVDEYLDGSNNATTGTFGDNGKDANGDGNTDYQGSYGTQSTSSNILIAMTPTMVGKYYTYVEVTNMTAGGASTTIRSQRAVLDIRNEDKLDKPVVAANVKIAPEFVFPDSSSNPGNANSFVGSRNALCFGAFDSTLFYTTVGLRTGSGWNNTINRNLWSSDLTTTSGGVQETVSMEYQKSANTGNRWTMDTNCVGSSSVYQDISTVPGAIYDVNFEHYSIGDGASSGDVLAATIAPSKFSSDDYASDVPNRYWDGSQGIGSPQGMNDDKGTYFFNIAGDTSNLFVGSRDLTTINAGKYPYGLNPGAQALGASGDPVVQPGIKGSMYGTDYFFDMTRYSLLDLYKGDNHQVYQFDLANATNTAYNKTGVVAVASTAAYANTKKAFTYGGENIVQFYSRDNLAQAGQGSNPNRKQFYYTVPEGQGATVEAFSSVANTNDANDNGIYNVQFSRISKPDIIESQDYLGHNTITVNSASTTYAYAIVDVSQGYPQYLDNVQQYTSDATINNMIGTGNNWFTTSNSSITFTDLGVGRTYRVIAVPQGAIQPETHSNVTPLDVLDTDAWVDTTIAVPEIDGHILGGTYKDAANQIKGRVRVRKANLGNYYALLAVDSTGKPVTDTAVCDWVMPDVNGEVIFDNLTLQVNDNHYVVIAKPQSFFNFSYADATYSPTELYQTGDPIPSGFVVGDPIMIATPVTITNSATYLALGVTEITRVLNDPNTDTVTITYDPTYRGGGTTFPANTTAIAYDNTLGTVAGLATANGANGSVDLSGLSTATFTIPTGVDYDVILQFGNHYDLPIRALAAPDPLAIDYVNENLLTAGKTGADSYNTQGNIDYRLKDDSSYYLGTSATKTVQGSNTQPISLTAVLDVATYSDGTGQLTYTKHIADATRTIGVQRTLSIPQRPDALSMGTSSENVIVDYPNEVVKNNSGKGILLSNNNFTTSTAVSSPGTSAFADLGWTGNADMSLYSRSDAIVDTAFKGKIASTTIIERPDAPVRKNGSDPGVEISVSGSNVTFVNDYPLSSLEASGMKQDGGVVSGFGLPGDITANGGSLQFTNHEDGNVYALAFKATATAPRSKYLEYATPLIVSSIDFGDVSYGQLGPKSAASTTTFPDGTIKKTLNLENTGATAYWLDVQYTTAVGPSAVMKFDNLGLFGFTGSDNVTDNYGGGALVFGDFQTLVNPNIIDDAPNNTNNAFNIVLGNVDNTGKWTPNLSRLNHAGSDGTVNANATSNINTAPVGPYTTRINLAYSDKIEGPSADAGDDITAESALVNHSLIPTPSNSPQNILKTPTNVSAEIRINIVKAQWTLPVIATQTSKISSGTDVQGLNYVVTTDSLDFDLLLDDEVTSTTLEISTNGGVDWVNPASLTFVSTPVAGQSIQHVSMTTTSDGQDIQPATTYTVLFKIVDDTNHTQSSTVTKTFWTQEAAPTDKNQFVDYYKETLNFTSDYGVTLGGTTGTTGDSVTSKFDSATQTLILTAKTLSSGNYPESNLVDFTYTRQAKPTLSTVGESIYYNGSGTIGSTDTTAAIEVRNDGAAYDGSTGISKTGLFSGVFHARTPATTSAFASEEVAILLLPVAYNVRVKSAATVDTSIGNVAYTRENASSLYFKKNVAQTYTTAFTDAVFSRIGYTAQASHQMNTSATDFTSGGTSVVVTDSTSQTNFTVQSTLFTNFKANLDSSNNFVRIVTWKGHEAPTYTVTIPATMAWQDTAGMSNSNSVTISAWDSANSQRTIPQGSTINLNVANGNSTTLTNAGANLTYSLSLNDATSTALNAGSLIQSLTAASAVSTPASQAFTATVSGTPQVSGTYTGLITFNVSLTLPNEGE